MTMIARIVGGIATGVALSELQTQHPHTLFPFPLTSDALPDGYVMVAPAPAPSVHHTQGQPLLINGVWTQSWTLRPLADIRDQLRAANLARKIATEQAGVAYEFPDGPGVAQTRDALDRANITGIVVSARIAKDNGVTDPVVPFKDAANLWHYMTPDQASVFGSAVANALLAIALKKSQIDGQIAALTSAEAAATFDIEAAWAA